MKCYFYIYICPRATMARPVKHQKGTPSGNPDSNMH